MTKRNSRGKPLYILDCVSLSVSSVLTCVAPDSESANRKTEGVCSSHLLMMKVKGEADSQTLIFSQQLICDVSKQVRKYDFVFFTLFLESIQTFKHNILAGSKHRCTHGSRQTAVRNLSYSPVLLSRSTLCSL